MQNSFTLSIPEPCHENWNTMTPKEKGRHCKVCAKTVVDFTAKTDREIGKIITSTGNICGRFKKAQLERPIPLTQKRDPFFELIPPSYAAALLIPIAIWSTPEVRAQETLATSLTQPVTTAPLTSTQPQKQLQGRIAIRPSPSIGHIIKGTVSDENGSLPGAVIRIKDKKIETRTDFDGNFEIEVNKEDTLIFSFIGYASKTIKINTASLEPLHILLDADMIMGDLIVMGGLRARPVTTSKTN